MIKLKRKTIHFALASALALATGVAGNDTIAHIGQGLRGLRSLELWAEFVDRRTQP